MNHAQMMSHIAESRREGWDHWEAIRFALNAHAAYRLAFDTPHRD